MPTYRTAGAWGAGKGADLTPTEVDQNFYDHETRLADIETNPPVAVSVASFTLNGTAMSFHLTDGTDTGEFDLPVLTFRWMGEWVTAAIYAALDVVTVTGSGLYLVLVDHVAAATFDPAALDTAVTAGSFVLNRAYVIQTIGTTDFTVIGAASNTVGLEFTATGVGSGTGTAAQKIYKQMLGDDLLPAPAYEVPTEGGTVTALVDERQRIIEPAAALNALTLVLPAMSADGDYELITTQTITALTPTPAGTETVISGAFTLFSRAKFTYRKATTTWYGP